MVCLLSGFVFQSSKALSYKTLITQELLKRVTLLQLAAMYLWLHTSDVIEPYLNALDGVFANC